MKRLVRLVGSAGDKKPVGCLTLIGTEGPTTSDDGNGASQPLKVHRGRSMPDECRRAILPDLTFVPNGRRSPSTLTLIGDDRGRAAVAKVAEMGSLL